MEQPIKQLNKLIGAFIFISVLALVEALIVYFYPSIRVKYIGDINPGSYIFSSLIVVVAFLLLALGIKKQNKIAYMLAYPLSILIIFRLKPIGLIVFILIIVWLVKTKELFFFKQNNK